MQRFKLVISLVFITVLGFAQNVNISGSVKAKLDQKPVKDALIMIQPSQQVINVKKDGTYSFQTNKGKNSIEVVKIGMQNEILNLNITKDTVINFSLLQESNDLKVVEIVKEKSTNGITRLKPVEGTVIYESKKNEVIVLDDFAANKSTNNARQLFAKVPGLNIWESDFAGLQLDIATRGLGPSRTANFNTRQNGYDMSADALGYPESYYMPASQAVEKIEVVRGAASLQYGPQFGGMLNFKLKEVTDTSLEVVAEQSIGSFGLLNSFVSIGGSKGKWNYYTYYQYREGDGWRDNSGFDSHTAFGKIGYQATKKLKFGFEYSFLNYVAQQPGGLTDDRFENEDLSISLRNRNWFSIDWNLFASTIDYEFSETSKLNIRTFGLLSNRKALGNLDQIGILDNPMAERTLISDEFANIGTEVRYLKEYKIKNKEGALATGYRYYRGLTERKQGLASADSTADFNFLNPDEPEEFDYDFPSENHALFAENLIYITKNLSLTTGFRLENIQTDAIGTWRYNRYDFAGNLLASTKNPDEKRNNRWVPLYGVGASYYLKENSQFYTNFSRNFRSITFSDLRVVNPNFQLDSLITDENGFNMDLGFRGEITSWLNVDISGFLMRYNNRIGQYEYPGSTTLFKTNIGDSRHLGVETFAEVDAIKLFSKEPRATKLALFVNYSYTNAVYVESEILSIKDKKVEYVPNQMIRSGINFKWKKFKATYQFSYLGDQYSDATNSEFNPNALTGVVPSYFVMDLAAEYCYKRFKLSSGINNLNNQRYFTRRAESYPGPGIIPATPRSFYIALAAKF